MGRLLFCLLLSLLCLRVLADPISVSAGEATVELTQHLHEWREAYKVSGDAIASERLNWVKAGDTSNKGYTSEAYWYRLILTNQERHNQLRLLEITYPLLDKIDFYVFSKSDSDNVPRLIEHETTGDRRPYSDRPIHGRTFVFPVDLSADNVQHIYFRVQSASSHQITARLWTNDAYIKYSNADATYRAVYYGSQLMLIIFILGLYVLMREQVYLLFGMTILGLLTLQMAMHGVLFQYVIPDWPLVHEYVILIIVPFILFTMLWFSSDYLDLRRLYRNWYQLYRLLGLIVLLALALVFILPYQQATKIGVALSVPVILLTLGTGIWLWSTGTKTARLFTFAWGALLLGCLVTILNQLGVISIAGASQYSIPLGASVQSILMAYALGDRFQKDRNDKVKAQQARFNALQKQRDAERELMRNATRNQLTGLCNRQVFEQVLDNYLKSYSRDSLAIGFWHIEGFNDYHKTLGHERSETLLRTVAKRLNSEAAELASIVRLDRDDDIAVANIETATFGCIVKNLCHEDTLSVIQKLANILRESIEFKGLSIEFPVRSGCAFSEPGMDVSTMQRHAFIAFGHNLPNEQSVTVYSSAIDSYSPRRLTLMTELRKALQNNEPELYFQPQVDLKTNRCTGFEALIRWTHPEYGFIPPDEFIPIAEETGVIREVTAWVVNKAVAFSAELAEWGQGMTVSVNISAENLRDKAFSKQLSALVRSGSINAEALILEITETAAMEYRETAIETLIELNNDGFKISIDDFGTGYSSLAYLDELPVYEIKIDRSFILKMQESEEDNTIIKATINIGHELGFKVIAEGVESAKVIEQLKTLGCDLAQGYYFAKPQTKEKTLAWLKRHTESVDH